MVKAPYHDRNEADYKDMSDRIDAALLEIDQDSNIPATQKELAKRAGCTRGTLRNRGWPLTRLKRIKEQRKTDSTSKTKKATAEHRANADVHIEDKKKLLQQLKDSRDELAIWVDKCKELEDEKKKLARAKTVLERAKASLENLVAELKREVLGLKARANEEHSRQVVVPLKKPLKLSSGERPSASARKKNSKRKK